MNRKLWIPAAALSALLALTACAGSSSGSSAARASASSSAPTTGTTVAAASSCMQQLNAWDAKYQKNVQILANGIKFMSTGLTAIAGDLQAGASQAQDTKDFVTLDMGLGTVNATTAYLQAHMPPSCVPGFSSDLGQGLTEVRSASTDLSQMQTDMGNLDYSDATTQAQLAAGEMQAGTASISNADTDVANFSGGS